MIMGRMPYKLHWSIKTGNLSIYHSSVACAGFIIAGAEKKIGGQKIFLPPRGGAEIKKVI